MILEFFRGLIELMRGYFKEVEEESIKDNFVIIYELLDECVDNGYVQCLDTAVLKEYIKTDYHELVRASKSKGAYDGPTVGAAVSWRKEGITHKENECFLDVIEKLNFTVALNGTVSRSEIVGTVKARSLLSGMPTVELGLNDKEGHGMGGVDISLDDVKFHRCVNLQEYESRQNIVFIPPDGEFDLMTYFIKTKVKPLFMVAIEPLAASNTRSEFVLKVTSLYKSSSVAHPVVVWIPVPCDLTSPTFATKTGEAAYVPDRDCISWRIPNLKGEETCSLEYRYALPTLVSRVLTSHPRRLPPAADPGRVRDPLLHHFRPQRQIHAHPRRVRLRGLAVGALYHPVQVVRNSA